MEPKIFDRLRNGSHMMSDLERLTALRRYAALFKRLDAVPVPEFEPDSDLDTARYLDVLKAIEEREQRNAV